ncbi:MAG TPA: protein kinase [Bryobacteraceae bacterium]|nr:protein kinase [Bryobacteraceae bacterium]
MLLDAHARLGPYEILAPIGAGGMGEVYRARDTRLDRTVAVKILPEYCSSSPQRRERFEREARAIASLSHPHICPLYDVGRQDDIDYLVMEYLEGQTLAERLKKGPLPADQLLPCAMQITEAVDAAHKHGVIHRDLKPGNIILTKAGAKVLDFGLAKVRVAEAASGETTLPIAAPLTAEGAILGTLEYMAPEQLEVKEADARTDIFALGAVIYEMATGRRAFEGKSQASLISAIMDREPPPISALQTMTPPALDHVVRTCLAKDPEQRWQTAHDLLVELQWIAGGGSQAAPAAPRRTRREMAAWGLAGVASAAAAVLAAMRWRERPSRADLMQFQIVLPARMTFEDSDFPVISPNGRQLVLAGTVEGNKRLWLRSLDSPATRPLAGTDGGTLPFWSPDARFIGFFAGRKLRKLDTSTGVIEDLCETGEGLGGIWSRDGVVVFSGGPGKPLQRVPATGGKPALLFGLDRQGGETDQLPLGFIAGSRHFLYSSSRQGRSGTYLASLDSNQTQPLIFGSDAALYAPPGLVISLSQGSLTAQPFDLDRLQLTGAAVRLAEHAGVFSVSDNGVLAYREATSSVVQLGWYNRDGKRLSTAGDPGEYLQIALSADEKRLTVEGPGLSDLWLLDLASGIRSRLTFKQASDAVWSPDGRQLVFSSNRGGQFDLYRKVVGGAEEELLFGSAEPKYPEDWSRDGSFLIFINEDGKKFYRLPLAGDRKPELLLETDFAKDEPHLSPDGRWIAYGSAESGRWEIYLASFPGFTQKRQVSNAGGGRPAWRGNGGELFYLSLDGKMMAVEVKSGATLETGPPRELFPTRVRVDPRQDQYCVTHDGQRFLLAEPVETSSVITVVINWAAGLKR